MKRKWIYKKTPKKEVVEKLSKEINVNTCLAKILVQRNINSFTKAKEFFRPALSKLYDPFLMLNMDKAVNRLTEAVFNKEKILIYGDYDVDGTTSVSLIYLFLKQFDCQLDFYLPDRYTEGYGISEKGINYAIEQDIDLIIVLDCGVRAIDQTKQAKEAAIDLIICDHHLPGEELPEVLALLDPKQKNCSYPFTELSGCGIGFKLLEGFCQQNTIDKEKLFQLLDLVAVSIACDLVSITGENRILAYHGLKKLNESPSLGLKSLMEISGLKKEKQISDVVFFIGPRINAAGRLAHAKESVKLLIGDTPKVNSFANNLNNNNKERKVYDQKMTAEALQLLSAEENRKSTVLFKKDWHKGVIGIVASRCIEHYYRPTIILTESNGKATGSARSVEGFDIYNAIDSCSDLLEQFGGHKQAAGLTLSLDNVAKFSEKFEKIVSKNILPEQLIPKILIDTEISFATINFKMYDILKQMGPFGPQNMSPLFSTTNVVIKNKPTVIKEKHIKGFLCEQNENKYIEFIGFGFANKREQMSEGKSFHIAYYLEENNYMGEKKLVINLKEIKFDT